METRADLNERLKLVGMSKGIYARLQGMTSQTASRHGDRRRVPKVAEYLVRAWEIMTEEQRERWLDD